jgi:hypothetical protein
MRTNTLAYLASPSMMKKNYNVDLSYFFSKMQILQSKVELAIDIIISYIDSI